MGRERQGRGGEGKGREALHATSFCILPQGYAPHLDLGSFIFKFQTFLGGRKQVWCGVGAEILPSHPGFSQLPLSLHQTSQFVNLLTDLISG